MDFERARPLMFLRLSVFALKPDSSVIAAVGVGGGGKEREDKGIKEEGPDR